MQTQARFRSIEAIEPTTITIDTERVVITHGDHDQPARVVPLAYIAKVKVRVLLGIATMLLMTIHGPNIVAYLLLPEDARAAAELIEQRAAAPESSPTAAVA